MSVYMTQPFVLKRIYGPGIKKFHLEHGRGVACEAVVVFDGLPMALVTIPVAAATAVPPTSGWVEFGQSAHGELQAYRALFGMLWWME